jgi:hypothetical protein
MTQARRPALAAPAACKHSLPSTHGVLRPERKGKGGTIATALRVSRPFLVWFPQDFSNRIEEVLNGMVAEELFAFVLPLEVGRWPAEGVSLFDRPWQALLGATPGR